MGEQNGHCLTLTYNLTPTEVLTLIIMDLKDMQGY